MTRGEIRNKIRKQLGETTSSFWTDAELNIWINDIITDLAWRTRCLRKTDTATSVQDTLEYTLSNLWSDLSKSIELYHYSNADEWIKIDRTTRDELDIDNPGWRNADSGQPTKYAYDLEEDSFILWPPADSTNAGADYLRMYYFYKPTDMADDDASPEIPDTLHEAIVEGVKTTGWESRGHGDRANNSRQIYLTMIKDYQVLREYEDDGMIIMRPAR